MAISTLLLNASVPIQPGTVDPNQRWVWHTRPRFILPLWEHAGAGAAQRYVRLAQTRRTARTWQLNTGAAAIGTPGPGRVAQLDGGADQLGQPPTWQRLVVGPQNLVEAILGGWAYQRVMLESTAAAAAGGVGGAARGACAGPLLRSPQGFRPSERYVERGSTGRQRSVPTDQVRTVRPPVQVTLGKVAAGRNQEAMLQFGLHTLRDDLFAQAASKAHRRPNDGLALGVAANLTDK
jgi:hypothetical protein